MNKHASSSKINILLLKTQRDKPFNNYEQLRRSFPLSALIASIQLSGMENNWTESPGTFPAAGMSRVSGSRNPTLWRKTVPQVFKETVGSFGGREALVVPQKRLSLTWNQLDRKVDEFAAGLCAAGLRKGDRIGIWSPNCPEWVIAQFATARIGLVLVNINPGYRRGELEYALNKVGCKALVTAKQFKTSNYLQMLRELAPEMRECKEGRLSSRRIPDLRLVIAISEDPGPGIMTFSEIQRMGANAGQCNLDDLTADLDPDDPINIQFTSGTTGSPKGATLTHYNIVNNARFTTDRMRFTEEDKLCIPVPLYHCFGMAMGTLGCVTKGAAMVLCGEAFQAEDTLFALSDAQCTGLYSVPTMFVAMLDAMKYGEYDLSALRTGVMAGAPCPIEVMRRVIQEMNMSEVTICYGMTETAPVSFQSFVDDPIEKRVSTVGRIHPHLDVRLIDAEGATVPLEEAGELCTRGYSVMQGYWGDNDLTRQSIRDGWMHTGDLAVLDADGFCNIVGRVKDMIIRGGENIYPREIENFLFRHPDVREAQVFGVPDEKFGEIVCAWIIPRTGSGLAPEDLRRFCKDEIAHFKIPAHFRIVDEMPMTVTGKPQKFRMREQMIEILANASKEC